MKLKRVARDAALIGLAFLGLQVLEAVGLRDAMEQNQRLFSHRLGVAAASLLNQAHAAKDDLVLFQTIHALAQSSGILRACIVDLDNKIIAHRDPSRLGERLDVYEDPEVYLFPLKAGDRTWGRLVLSISDHFSRRLEHKRLIMGSMAAAFVWGVLFVYLQYLEKRMAGSQTQIEELKGLLKEEKRRGLASEERAQLETLRAAAYLQKAVSRMGEPLLVLDAHQRLTAINAGAMTRLGLADSPSLLGKSWHEIPVLNTCGTGLERSIAFPGQSVPCPTKIPEIQFRLETDAEGLCGTWVSVESK